MVLSKLHELGLPSSAPPFLSMVFSASSYDSTLFFRRSDHGIILFLLYVDDMIITGNDVQGI